ncbi:hypothetical protein [Clostridium rhizosphaerae]|nr:hypothetical protein [Clostridium rhizosphaerae]
MKKILTIIISLLLTFSLTACGSQNTSTKSNTDTTASATQHK